MDLPDDPLDNLAHGGFHIRTIAENGM